MPWTTRIYQPTLSPSNQRTRRCCHKFQRRPRFGSSWTRTISSNDIGRCCRVSGWGSDNFRDALDLKFYSALEHADYGDIDVLPREYIVYLETDHCPMDVSVIEDIKAQYYRGKETDERLSKFAMRLNEEQTRLAADGVVIPEPDKLN